MEYKDFFQSACGTPPFPFQERFALELPELVRVPTGLGKTAMAVLGWLWRRQSAEAQLRDKTPRRLVYCLPMRVLVEQTKSNAEKWIAELKNKGLLPEAPEVHLLMGGEEDTKWEAHPEKDALLIGTQDMLLSRALNRGYAESRARWPMSFGLLHTDCLWVFDEVQLMGPGLATTAQLEAFRRLKQGAGARGSRSVWMSATLETDWLKTVDFAPHLRDVSPLELAETDLKDEIVSKRWAAPKALKQAEHGMDASAAGVAGEVLKEHRPGSLTLVVVNTVRKAREVYAALRSGEQGRPKRSKKAAAPKESEPIPELVLLHSRFRPQDRQVVTDKVLALELPSQGRIVVSTQVIEAGVDLDARTLFTDAAPWASLVQRFGRCNRKGEDTDARVFWFAPPAKDGDGKWALPYESGVVREAVKALEGLNDAGPRSLKERGPRMKQEHLQVIRRKDLWELFDTTPDLAGNDLDIDRFIRDVEQSDVHVCWRDWTLGTRSVDEPEAERLELCPVPIGEFKDFLKARGRDLVLRWNFVDDVWEKADRNRVTPGQTFLIHATAGGYPPETGWDLESKEQVTPVQLPPQSKPQKPDSIGADALSRTDGWQTIAEHSRAIVAELTKLAAALNVVGEEKDALHDAARWHDRGKAHRVFQDALPAEGRDGTKQWAKAPKCSRWGRYQRSRFRHELASALALLAAPADLVPDKTRDLAAYLAAAHHGKVRLSIRSFPDESKPKPATDTAGRIRRFARGIWDGDVLPVTDLGGDVTAPECVLSLEPMELGLCQEEPFKGQPSWTDKMSRLRDALGPFRLAYLEAVLRAADWRVSRSEGPVPETRNADAAQKDKP